MLKPAGIAGLLAPSATLRGLGMSSYSHDGSSSCRFWQITIFFAYSTCRVDCPKSGVAVEEILGVKARASQPELTDGSSLVGQALLVESRIGIPHHLGSFRPLGRTRQCLGLGAADNHWNQDYRRRRGSVGKGPSLHHVGSLD